MNPSSTQAKDALLVQANELQAISSHASFSPVRVKNKAFIYSSLAIWLSGICIYLISLIWVSKPIVGVYSTTQISFGIIIFFTISLLVVSKIYHYPLSKLGLNTRNWRTAIKESLLFSILLLPLSIFIKWLTLSFMSDNSPLFNPMLRFAPNWDQAYLYYGGIILIYIISCPLQELVRSYTQTIIQELFSFNGRKATYVPSFIASLSFAIFHLHISIGHAIGTFVLSFFWGCLFTRHKTLIGVILSHTILGIWLQFVLGLDFLK